MKFSFAIICLLLFANRSDGRTTYISIYDPKIDECSRYVAETFFRALENDEFKILSLLVKKGAKIDTNELKKFKSSFTLLRGYPYFYLKDKPFCYQRAYFKEEAGKRMRLFKISLLFKEKNNFIIDEVKIEDNFNLPRKLKRMLAKVTPNLSDKERINAILAVYGLLPPPPPSGCECLYGIDWKRDIVYLAGDECNDIEPYIKKYELLNELGFPIGMISYRILDSIGVPPWIQELKNLDYLRLYAVDIKSVSVDIGNLKNIKRLRLILKRVEIAAIPASIGNLEQLEELTIFCKECTELPTALRKLKNLKKFEFSGNKLNQESKRMVVELGGTIKHME